MPRLKAICAACGKEPCKKDSDLGKRCSSFVYYHTMAEIRTPGHWKKFLVKNNTQTSRIVFFREDFRDEVRQRKLRIVKQRKRLDCWMKRHTAA